MDAALRIYLAAWQAMADYHQYWLLAIYADLISFIREREYGTSEYFHGDDNAADIGDGRRRFGVDANKAPARDYRSAPMGEGRTGVPIEGVDSPFYAGAASVRLATTSSAFYVFDMLTPRIWGLPRRRRHAMLSSADSRRASSAAFRDGAGYHVPTMPIIGYYF